MAEIEIVHTGDKAKLFIDKKEIDIGN